MKFFRAKGKKKAGYRPGDEMRPLESCIKTTENAPARLVIGGHEYDQMAVIITSGPPGLAHYWHIDGFPLTATPVHEEEMARWRWKSLEREAAK